MTLVGAYGSPYSIKMRAVLRYRRIPYRWVVRNSSQDRGFPDPPVPIIPVLVFHDDVGGYTESMVDSSPQIMRLETEYAQRSLLPTDPVVWFLDHLIEDYGDEWLTKVMYHYRWHHLYGDAIAKASNMLPLMSDNQMDVEKHRAMSEFIAERQMGRTRLTLTVTLLKRALFVYWHSLKIISVSFSSCWGPVRLVETLDCSASSVSCFFGSPTRHS